MPLHLVQFIILKLFEAKAEKSSRRGNKSFSAARNVCYIIATKGLVKKYRGGWAGAFGNVADKKHMTHPLPSAQK